MFEFPEGLEEKLNRASTILESNDKFRIITHYDADGISASAVLTRSLMKVQAGFHTSFVESFPENIPEGLPLLFTDIGNSHLDQISRVEEDVIVLDHHDIKSDKKREIEDEKKIVINPHEYGIDGAQEVSGGTLALLLAVWFDNVNWEEAVYGLAGAAADKQAVDGFTGLNKKLAEKAAEEGYLEERTDLFIDGKGIKEALMKACDPYFPGISGERKEIKSILKDLDIDPESNLKSIGQEKKRELASLLVLSLLKKRRPAELVESIRGVHYRSRYHSLDTDRLYKILNSCARNNRPGLGLSLCLGDENALEEAKEIRDGYRTEMVEKLDDLEEKMETYDHIQYFYEEEKTRKGELAGLGMLYLLPLDKPVFGLVKVDDEIDISARATREMVNKGLDLGELCSKISERVGGTGGGHDIAAGARIKKDKIDRFLESMNKEVAAVLD
ncbi:MAG: DHH family phosphoesterase [Candidatus Thermoplasmatota archaeon]|nr:DHH family phosphoesterase [Candidatus Thermoplasmatota archaeon]